MAYINGGFTTADASSNSVTSSPNIAVTTGQMLVGIHCWVDALNTINITAIADTAGNTFIAGTKKNAGGTSSQMFYTYNTIPHATNVVAVQLSAATTFRTLIAEQYSTQESFSDPFMLEATPNSGTSTTPTSSAFTTTSANCTIVAMGAMAVTPITAGTGYTLRDSGNFGASEDKHVTSIQTGVTAGFTTTGSNAWNVHVMVFNDAIYDRVETTDTIGSQNILVLVPNANATNPYNAGNPTGVVMYSHGLGETQLALFTDTLKAACVKAFLNAGYICCGTNAHGNNFGYQASVDDYAALDKYVRDNYNVLGNLIWAQSMGGLTGLSLISQNRVKGVCGWLGTYPITNLSAAYNGTGGTNFSSYIDTAYGITGSGIATYANLTYGYDPCVGKSGNWAFRGTRFRFYASASDTAVGKTQNTDTFQAIITAWSKESVIVAASGNHGDPSHFVPSEYTAFAARAFADMVPFSGSGGIGIVPMNGRLAS